jgi:hypothetical protein
MWENIDGNRRDSAHYSVLRLKKNANGMGALRCMFPDGKADELNFVLFSTSGVHGTYNTIEEAEQYISGLDDDGISEVTFVIIHPRLVAIRYGACNPKNNADIEYLKQLRESSHKIVLSIGSVE